ncbi:MAG: potassium channel family protein [Gammaproteobacteria bacterium]
MKMVFLLNVIIVATVVMIHYEFLYRFSRLVPRMRIRHRFRILISVYAALIAHSIEIFVFAVAYYFLHQAEGWGTLRGNFNGSMMDCIYYSFTTFTTLGFGDIEPFGDIRYLTGLESLSGLVMITWTASFLYYEMQRYWDNR